MATLSLKPLKIVSDSIDVYVSCQFLKHLCTVSSLVVEYTFIQTEQYLFMIPRKITFLVLVPTIQSYKYNLSSIIVLFNYK
jgi:hypothetical protein